MPDDVQPEKPTEKPILFPPDPPPPQPCAEAPQSAVSKGLAHLADNWKSTAANVLTCVVVAGGFFAAIPSQMLQQNGITQKEIFWGTCIVGLAKIYVGLITKDAK